MTNISNEQFCFPLINEFKKQYSQHLKNKLSSHEIEYTLPTTSEMLAGKCVGNDDLDFTPILADMYYTDKMCGTGNKSLCASVVMNSPMRADMIKSTLDKMATKK